MAGKNKKKTPAKPDPPPAEKIKKEKLNSNISIFKRGNDQWINITAVTKGVTDYLAKKHKISNEDLLDTLPPLQRSKLLVRKNYIFVILLFPYEDKATNTIQVSEIDFFIFKHKLVTLHRNKLEPIKNFPGDLMRTDLASLFIADFSPAHLVNHLLTNLYEHSLPVSNNVANEIDEIEEQIYGGGLADKSLVEKIFTIDRKVVDLRKVLRIHQLIIDKLIKHLPTMSQAKLPHDLLQDLGDLPISLWTNLESHMEAIDALQSSYESLTSYRLNDIIRTLTIISIIIAPLALIAGIYGMNFEFIPYSSHPLGFLLVIIVMLVVSLMSLLFFKHKKWF